MNENYVLLKDVLGQHFDVVLVLAYRRFYEWLPSLKHQIDKPLKYEKSKVLWPGGAGGNGTAVGGGTALQPLFPIADKTADDDAAALDGPTSVMFDGWRRHHFFSPRTMHTIRKLTASNFSLKIYHLYGKLSVRTNFLCRILEDADYSCRASRKQDALQQETRINARSSAVVYPWAFFDAMATTAAAHKFIDTENWKRQTVARMLRDHYYKRTQVWEKERHESVDGEPEDNASDGSGGDDAVVKSANIDTGNALNVAEEFSSTPTLKNPWELPLLCPTERQFDQLLHLSLSLEAMHLPKLYRKAAMEHRAAFRAATTSPASAVAYCWIDLEALFGKSRDDTNSSSAWQEYIVETFSSSAAAATSNSESQ